MRPALFLYSLFMVLFAGIVPGHAGDKVALVIGNSDYKHAGVLNNPANDAKAIAAQLKTIGFSVKLALDQTYNEMRRAVRDFAHTARSADIAMIYYAGHGIELSGRNFLVPTDAKLESDADVDYEAIPMQQLLNSIEGARKTGLVILDACRNNPFSTRMVKTRGLTRSVSRGLAGIEPSSNVLVAYSAKHGTVAEDGNGDNSPYATALLKYMAVPGLDIQLMFRKVRDDVLKETSNRQQPFTYGSIGGTEIPLFAAGNTAETMTAPAQPGKGTAASAPAPVQAGPNLELEYWNAVKDSKSASMFKSYLKRFPEGYFADIAQLKITALEKKRKKTKTALVIRPTPHLRPRPANRLPSRTVEPERPAGPASDPRFAGLQRRVNRAARCRTKRCLCSRYGRLSVQQHKANKKYHCGFGWPAWHDNAGAHRTWCDGFLTPITFVISELKKRNVKLANCLGR